MSANTLLTSTVTGGVNSHTTTAEEANSLSTDFVTQGVVGAITLNSGSGGSGSFCVNADGTPDMGVAIKAGQAYVTATPSSQNSQVLRVRASSDYTAYTINANSSGSTKYDWIYLKIDATKANAPASDASDVASFVTSRSSSNTTDNGTPPTYGLLLAIVTVANGASSITNSNITDKRFNASIGAQNGSLIITQNGTGTDAKVQAAGIDANVNISITPKGTGVVEIGENSSSVSQISASGSDANIDIRLSPKGTGYVKRGTSGGAIDWWEELGRVTLGVSGAVMSVPSFTARKYLRVITSHTQVGTTAEFIRFNNDSGNNYARSSAVNGAADTSVAAVTAIDLYADTSQRRYTQFDIVNVSSLIKMVIYELSITSAATAAVPNRVEGVGVWVNTAAQISRIDYGASSGSFAAGSEMIILGHD